MGRTYCNACVSAVCLYEKPLAIHEGREVGSNFCDGLRCQQVLDVTLESVRNGFWEQVSGG